MVSYCAVIGCGNDSECEIDKTFFKIPLVIQNANGHEAVLSQLRQQAWIANLSSSNLNFEDLDDYRVCSDHFVQGEPCKIYDVDNVDWVPTQNLSKTRDNIWKGRRNTESLKGKKRIVTPDSFVCNKEITTTSKFEPVVDVGVQENNCFINVSEQSRTCSNGVLKGAKSEKKDYMKRVDSAEETLTHIIQSTKDIRWDHTYSKKAIAIEGDLSDSDSSRTVSAASPPCYYSGDDDDFIFTPATSAIVSENEPLVDNDKENYILFVKSEGVHSEVDSLPDLSVYITNILGAMEVIEISDDDIAVEDIPKKKPSGMKRPFRCINSECRTEKDLICAKQFVRRYFGTPPSRKKRKVCRRCFDKANQEQDHLTEVLQSGRLLLAEKLPPPKTTVVLTDSDSDPSDYRSSSEGSELEVECDEGKTLEETIENIMTDLQLDNQINLGIAHLDKRLKAVQEGFDKLHAEEYASIEKQLDMVRTEFYNSFRPEIMWLPGIDIGPSSTVIHQPDGTSEVIAERSIYKPIENLPPVGPLNRYELQSGEMCFCMKYSLFARWVQAQAIEVDKREPNNTFYKIRYNRNAKSSGSHRVLPGRQLAYFSKCLTRIPVGTRVIAIYKDEDPKNLEVSGSFYVGVLAEIPTAANKYRYLVFFDDGYAQYVHHNDIRVVTEASDCPWDDVSSDSREFIKEYLQMYPERPMVRLQKYNFVKTEYNGRWWRAQVMEVDGSLVRMFFPVDCRSEWIYRGSTRLSPLFNKKMNIQAQAEHFKTIRRRTAGLPGRAIVEYGTFGQGHDVESANQGERRAVAKKSTMSRACTPPKDVQVRVEQESTGFTNKHALQEKIMKYRRHVCCSKCLEGRGDYMMKHKDVSPLLHPILQGWNRLVVKQRRKAITKNEIIYVTPCGLRLRSIEEVFQYIVDTESNLEIDCFSFETGVEVSHEWEPFKKILFIEDITDGEENMKISCVNSLDATSPIKLLYSNVRLPTEHVPLNLEQGFLVCCDCLDNCQNKDKCPCRQLTIQGTQILNHIVNPTAGYQHRRLYDQVQSGIYECNSRCTCAQNRCSNRVVQHPLRLKLQLFKTARRGWGVRSLCDIPRGAFICVYVGKMLSESIANEEGKQMIGGDDYYAELDYIEVMENAKEGFEEEAILPEEESLMGSDPIDSDGLFSENDADDLDEDRDFSQPSYHKNDAVGKRQKSARLQERARGTKSNHTNKARSAPRSEEEKTKNDGDKVSGSKGGSATASRDPSEDEEDDDEKQRRPQTFLPSQMLQPLPNPKERKSVREYYGKDESVYIMDAKQVGNIGRYLNHSCEPNVFVQNVFVDTHDLRFPWVAFFAIHNIRAGTELTWDYNYEVDSVPGKIKYCYCGAKKCRGRLL